MYCLSKFLNVWGGNYLSTFSEGAKRLTPKITVKHRFLVQIFVRQNASIQDALYGFILSKGSAEFTRFLNLLFLTIL